MRRWGPRGAGTTLECALHAGKTAAVLCEFIYLFMYIFIYLFIFYLDRVLLYSADCLELIEISAYVTQSAKIKHMHR